MCGYSLTERASAYEADSVSSILANRLIKFESYLHMKTLKEVTYLHFLYYMRINSNKISKEDTVQREFAERRITKLTKNTRS